MARFNRIDRRHAQPGVRLKFPARVEDVADYTPLPRVYPPAKRDAKLILVDLSEQFLGAYEFGRLVFSTPATTGEEGNETPVGDYRVTAYHSLHSSTLYTVENTAVPYPMTYALRFHVTPMGVAFWIHGRDVPGRPASHGCIGLYDEVMQRKHYGFPGKPELEDARALFEWAIEPRQDDGKFRLLEDGPRVLVVGTAPKAPRKGRPGAAQSPALPRPR